MTLPRRLSMLGVPRLRSKLGEVLVTSRREVTTVMRYAGNAQNIDAGAAFNNLSFATGDPNGQYNGASAQDTYSQTRTLRAFAFGFSETDIPDRAVIVGTRFEIRRYASGYKAFDRLNTIAIGETRGANRSLGVQVATSAETASYGGARDTFGLALTAADVRSSDFAVLFGGDFQFINGLSDSIYWLDAVGLQITYLI